MADPFIPPAPSVPAEQRASGATPFRFEDLTQDGRLRMEGIWPPIGSILWGKAEGARALSRLSARGVRAVLTTIALEAGEERCSLMRAAEHEVRYRLGHTTDEAGAVNRLLFDVWLESHAGRGAPYGVAEEPGAPRVLAARAFGRHVFTRPAAKAGEHRVLSLDEPDLPSLPPERLSWQAPEGLLTPPPGAELLDPAPQLDPVPVAFGLTHTDLNQHVNFLVYPRLLEDAALRALARRGERTALLARRVEVAYRKPCFAGDRARWALQLLRTGDGHAVLGALYPESPALLEGRPFAELGRPYCLARMELRA